MARDEERAHWEQGMEAREPDEDESLDEIHERMTERMIGRPKAQAEPLKPHVVPSAGQGDGMPPWVRGLMHIALDYDEITKEWIVRNLPEDTPAFVADGIRMLRNMMGPPDTLPQRTEEFLRKIPGAVDRARLKHPWSGDRWKALGALTGEVGELANTMNKGESQERIESEALDVIATAIRLVVQG